MSTGERVSADKAESAARRSAPLEATVLDGRYVLGEPLGRGGMAEVFRARDTVLNREVAVKVFHQHAALPDSDARRAAEIHLLASLSHAGLVMVFDAGRDTTNPADPFAYLVMELVEGSTLARAIAEGPMAGPELADIAGQLAAALTYVHERGIVHRDIKPANVLLTPRDRSGRTIAKLTDFGVARLLDSTRLTVAGTTLGTANYLSPEQATGAEITTASDIYSFGLVLFEALTGQVAFPGSGVEAAVVRLHRAPVIPGWVDEGWRALLTDMTASAPADRPDAAAVSIRLRALRHDTAPTAVFGRPPTNVKVRHPRRPLWIAAALAIVAAVIAVVLGVASGGDRLPGTPTASYPRVVGTLGAHLSALAAAVPAALSGNVSAVAVAAANNDFATARAALQKLSTDLVAARRSGDISPAGYRRAATAIALLRSDLRTALHAVVARSKSASVTVRKSATATSTRAPTTHPVAPPPVHHVPPGQAKKEHGPKRPKPPKAHGPGHGPGPGEGDDG